MRKSNKTTLSDGYGIFFLVLTILLGGIFLLQTASVYFDGMDAKEQAREETRLQAEEEGWSDLRTDLAVAHAANAIPIYSRAIAGERLRQLVPFVCVWLVALVAGMVISVLTRKTDSRPERAPELMLSDRLKKQAVRLPQSPREGSEAAFAEASTNYRNIKRTARRFLCALCGIAAVCLIFPFLYFADFSHFPNEDINREVAHAVLFALPFLAVLLAGGLVYVYAQNKLLQKEAATVKELMKTGKPLPPPATPARTSGRRLLILRLSLLAVGLSLVLLGCFNGSMHEVLVKATKICTECIGLG